MRRFSKFLNSRRTRRNNTRHSSPIRFNLPTLSAELSQGDPEGDGHISQSPDDTALSAEADILGREITILDSNNNRIAKNIDEAKPVQAILVDSNAVVATLVSGKKRRKKTQKKRRSRISKKRNKNKKR
jgi:hypothetical protein